MFTPSDWMLKGWRGFRRQVFPGLLAVFVVCAWPAKLVAAPQWKVLETPRFTVVSQISEKETREWAEEFNQFIEAMKGLLKLDERLLSPLIVVIFDREKDFASYRPLAPDGKPMEWVTGFFGRRDAWGTIGMLARWEEESMRRNIYQEGAYWMLSADPRWHPAWFTFGVAQVFSSFSIEGGKAKWGDPLRHQLDYLHTRRQLPLDQFLFVSQSDKMFSGSEGPDLFYAQSWLFVHFLMFGQRKEGQGTMGEYLMALQGQSSTAEAFQKTFGMDYAAMETALERYLSNGRFRMFAQPLEPSAKITAFFSPASPALVQAALAKLAYSAQRNELARKHAEEAVKLDPASALGQKMLGWVKHDSSDLDGCLAAAEKSVELGASDADAFFLLALAKWKKAQSLGGIPSGEARQISTLYEKAINLSPGLKTAYMNLAAVLPQVDELNDQDELFVGLGLKLFPGDPALLVGHACLLRKKGNKEEALKLVQTLCDEPGKLTPDQLKNYTSLKSSWDANDTLAQANGLLKQKQPKEVLALLDGLLKRNPPIVVRNQINQLRSMALAADTLQEARAAQAAGRIDEAVRLFQSLADMEKAPPNLRGIARTALQKLNRAPATPSSTTEPAPAGQ